MRANTTVSGIAVRFKRRVARGIHELQLSRLAEAPSRTPVSAKIGGRTFRYIDGPSFTSAYRAIFLDHIYRFEVPDPSPRIIDCGANVGLAIVYWKSLYPDARITAFEPDGTAFDALEINCSGYRTSVELVRAAVWSAEGEMTFVPDGADAGRLDVAGGAGSTVVATMRLRDRLTGSIDLLKLDIEGAETAVLEDCSDRLGNVRRIFVEYHGFADRPQDLDVLLRLLSGAGFRWHIKPEFVSPAPFLDLKTDRGMDQRLNIFAVRGPSSRV